MESISMGSIEPLGFFTGSFLSILATEIVFEQDEFIYPQITQINADYFFMLKYS